MQQSKQTSKPSKFPSLFPVRKPIIGMIHLAGETRSEVMGRACHELDVYEEFGIDGAIFENYHTKDIQIVCDTIHMALKTPRKIVLGVNVLPNEFDEAFEIAGRFGLKFIQLDYVAGNYAGCARLDDKRYFMARSKHPDVAVLGGVWPKYYKPEHGSNLTEDLNDGMINSDAIVVTGEATGRATPIHKIKEFRRIIGRKYPLVVGAGLNPDNAYLQLMIADGAIVGTSLKFDDHTHERVHTGRVKTLMDVVRQVRESC